MPLFRCHHAIRITKQHGTWSPKKEEMKMKRFRIMIWAVVPLAVALLVTACATYYKVRDPGTGNTYYTEKVKHESGGAATFKDARSGAEVTIQNSEVKEITKGEYTAGISAPASTPAAAPTAAPAPAPSTAPAPAPAPKPTLAPAPAPEAAPAPEPGSTPVEPSK
jgi:hypothetical protein